MSGTSRDQGDDTERAGGVGWDGVPEGTSGSAAPGTEAAPDDAGRVQPTGEGADAARQQYADQSKRAQQSLEDAGINTIGRNESEPTSRPLGGPTTAPGPDATGLTTARPGTGALPDDERGPAPQE